MAAFAQVIQIRGTVADAEKGSAISNINIFLKDTRIGTVSDQSGSFAINLPSTYG
ncbi:MAG: carboxypeptidase-like regulatory domain-containing protein, partial [Tannerella sp.]|nr:carboxypeptidase-like regulatory domain-containing protein [Tannerella sp.]